MEQHLAHYARNVAILIEHLGGKCVICESVEMLEIDHIDRSTKLYSVTEYLTRVNTPKYIWDEIEKCQLLCKLHHIEKTKLEIGVPHGEGLWGKRNCSCRPCKDRKAESMREKRRLNPGYGR